MSNEPGFLGCIWGSFPKTSFAPLISAIISHTTCFFLVSSLVSFSFYFYLYWLPLSSHTRTIDVSSSTPIAFVLFLLTQFCTFSSFTKTAFSKPASSCPPGPLIAEALLSRLPSVLSSHSHPQRFFSFPS